MVQNPQEASPYSVALLFQKSNPPKLSAKEEQENLTEKESSLSLFTLEDEDVLKNALLNSFKNGNFFKDARILNHQDEVSSSKAPYVVLASYGGGLVISQSGVNRSLTAKVLFELEFLKDQKVFKRAQITTKQEGLWTESSVKSEAIESAVKGALKLILQEIEEKEQQEQKTQ